MIIVLMSTMAIKKSLSFTGILLLWNQGSVSAAGARLRNPDMQEWRGFHIKSSTMEAEQSSSSKVTKSQWGKVILKPSLPPGICNTGGKKSLSYLLIVFPFPFGGVYYNEKRNEGRLFLTKRFVNTVDFTGRADICGSCKGEQKMSLINQKQNDQWPVSAAMRKRGCEQHSTAYHSSPNEGRHTKDDFHPRSLGHLGSLSLIALRNGACWLHPRGIFRKSLKTNQWVTSWQKNMLPRPLMTGIHQQHN